MFRVADTAQAICKKLEHIELVGTNLPQDFESSHSHPLRWKPGSQVRPPSECLIVSPLLIALQYNVIIEN